ncbi:MAG: DUF2059 domain-containing protein [Acidobacteriaceae bacterium]|jgi:hypothetical protein
MRKIAWLFLLGTLPVWAGTTTAKPGVGTNVAGATSENLAPEHPVTAAQVHEILRLTGTNTLQREMLDGMLPYLKQMMPYMPADVVADLQRTLGTADFEGAMVRSFQQHLSTEDAAQIIAFYESPAGKHMIGVMPRILNEGQDAGSELGQQVMFEVIQRHKDEIDAAAKVYHEEHPATAPQQ